MIGYVVVVCLSMYPDICIVEPHIFSTEAQCEASRLHNEALYDIKVGKAKNALMPSHCEIQGGGKDT